MAADTMNGDYDLNALAPTTTSRIEEIHLLHSSQGLIESLERILTPSADRPHLKALTCIYRLDNPRFRRPVPLYHNQLPVLQHLYLGGVPFCLLDTPLRQSFPTITNLILSRLSSPNTFTDIESLLRLCPNLRSVVLAPFSLFDPSSIPLAATPLPPPSSLRRLILHDVDTRAFGFFLSLFPLDHPFALQLLTNRPMRTSFQYNPVLKERLHGKFTHLHVSVVPASSSEMGAGYRLSVTLATDRTAVRVASFVGKHLRWVDYGSDVWLKDLLSDSDDPLVRDFSNMHEAWFMNVTPALTPVAALGPFHEDAMAALRRMPLLDTIVLVTIYRSYRGHGSRVVYSPDLFTLPSASAKGLPTPHPPTLRLACYDTFVPNPQCAPAYNENEAHRVSFERMLEQLASGTYDGRFERLVVQLSLRFEIDKAETVLRQLRRHFRTVTVERIEKMPQIPAVLR